MNEFILKSSIAFTGSVVAMLFGIEPLVIYILIGLSILDVITGIIRAKINNKPIHSTPLGNGVLKKILPLLAIIIVNWGALAIGITTGASVDFLSVALALWFIGVELKSNLENIQASGILIPKNLSKKIDNIFNTNFTNE